MSELTAAEYLKENTRAAHRAAERAAAAERIMRGDIGATHYQALILSNYQVWQSIDRALRAAHSAQTVLPTWAAYRLPLADELTKDLILLNLSPSSPGPGAETALDWTDPATAWGTLYVLNGSTLGGRQLYRALRANPRLGEVADFYFYRACADLPPARWPAFRQALNAGLTTSAAREQARRAAVVVFELFTKAYRASSS